MAQGGPPEGSLPPTPHGHHLVLDDCGVGLGLVLGSGHYKACSGWLWDMYVKRQCLRTLNMVHVCVQM